jgi:hypothetical protein
MLINQSLKDKLKDVGLPVQQTIAYLLCTYFGIDVNIIKLSKPYILQLYRLGILEITKSGILVKGLFEDFTSDKVTHQSIEEIVSSNIDSYRSLFRGIKPGSLGNKQDCVSKMIRWMYTNPSYTFNDILNKTNSFIQIKLARNEGIFIPQADYFIYKVVNGEEKSTLSTIIDEEFVEYKLEKVI